MNRQTDMPTDDEFDFHIDESAIFEPIFVPWRSFKAFLTVYDIGVGGYQPGYMEGTQALSRNVTGDKVRASLLKHGLIEARDDGKEIWIKYLKGIPFGRHTEGAAGTELWVCPDSGSAQGSAWLKSEGRCHYSGEPLRFFSSLAFHPDDGRFACKSCYGTKGTRTLEEWRFMAQWETATTFGKSPIPAPCPSQIRSRSSPPAYSRCCTGDVVVAVARGIPLSRTIGGLNS